MQSYHEWLKQFVLKTSCFLHLYFVILFIPASTEITEETNILYVAMTHAKRQLIMHNCLLHVMKVFGIC